MKGQIKKEQFKIEKKERITLNIKGSWGGFNGSKNCSFSFCGVSKSFLKKKGKFNLQFKSFLRSSLNSKKVESLLWIEVLNVQKCSLSQGSIYLNHSKGMGMVERCQAAWESRIHMMGGKSTTSRRRTSWAFQNIITREREKTKNLIRFLKREWWVTNTIRKIFQRHDYHIRRERVLW